MRGAISALTSYTILPTINDRIRHFRAPGRSDATATFAAVLPQVPKRIPAIGSGGSGDPVKDRTNSTIAVAGVPNGDVITDVNVTVSLTHAADSQFAPDADLADRHAHRAGRPVGFFGDANF